MPNPNSLAFIVSKISPFIRMDRQTNMSKFFLQLLLVVLVFKPSKKVQKIDSQKNSALSISAKIKKSLVLFKRNLNDLSIDAIKSIN